MKNSSTRFNLIYIFVLFFIAANMLFRTILFIKYATFIDHTWFESVKIFATGLLFDFVTACYFMVPFVLYLIFVPQVIYLKKIHKYFIYSSVYIILFILIFSNVAEYFFWEEFNARFNFIAVDYLVYTHEVIGNIVESYPIYLVFFAIGIITTILFTFIIKLNYFKSHAFCKSSFKQRILKGSALLVLPLIFSLTINNSLTEDLSKDNYNNELAKNGIHSLFAAFRNNILKYNKFYCTLDNKMVLKKLRHNLITGNSSFINDNMNDICRIVKSNSKKNEKKYNIILVIVESLSAKYLGVFSNADITPHIDKIAKQGILFTNFYATGTRTTRGIEALILSVPPTPGRSIVKRQGNENRFSAGFIFKERGYDTKFIYGGYGYFDNMNYFFKNNGFATVDRVDFKENEKTFGNIWGLCDEDLFKRTIRECDKSYKKNKPFFNVVLTTSNHRPYTYPDGKINIPSHSGRSGAVKYTDYSINELIESSKTKPWFRNTIFAIIADHCAGSAGKTKLPIERYQIPLILYNPYLLKPQTNDKLSCQIDVMPTILGLLGWEYKTKFFGKNIFEMTPKEERALIGNYQKLGLLTNNTLAVLAPQKKKYLFSFKRTVSKKFLKKYSQLRSINFNKNELANIVSYYQGAAYLEKNGLNKWKDCIKKAK